jgi:hypothetical protein
MPTITINAFDASKLPSTFQLASWRQDWVTAVWGEPTAEGAAATFTVEGLTPDVIEEIISPEQAQPEAFLPGLELLASVEAMVAPLGGDPPTYPHYLTRQFINHQLDLLSAYVVKNSAE